MSVQAHGAFGRALTCCSTALLCVIATLVGVARATAPRNVASEGACRGAASTSTGDRCFYISFSSGSDAHGGRSESSPWREAPGMRGFRGSYSHRPGDHFVFEGGVIWPNGAFPLRAAGSGRPGNDDYYGVDRGWYAGGGFSKPTFSAGGRVISGASSAGNPQDVFVDLRDRDYIEVDGIRFTGFTARGLTAYGSCAGIDINSEGGGGDRNIVINGVAFSGTSIDETSDHDAECALIAAYTGAPWAGNSIVENSTFAGAGRTFGIAIECVGNVEHNSLSGMTGNIYPCGHGVISSNTISGCGYPRFPSAARGLHADAIQTNASDGAFYIHDNVIRGTGGDGNGNECEAMFLGNAGETDYVWNNVLYDLHGNSPALTQGTQTGNAAYFWNNTIVGGAGGRQSCLRDGHGDPPVTVWQNNLCISWAGRSVAGGASTSTENHDALLTPREAAAAGFTAREAYAYSPGRTSPRTTGAGIDLSAHCWGPLVSLCAGTSYAGARATSARRGADWNVGAY